MIRVGDEVEILTRGPAKAYGAGESDDTPAPEAQQQATVAIEWQGQQFTGNQQVLLEQLEQQGIRVPYSCRAGSAAAAASGWKRRSESVKENAVAGDGTSSPAAVYRKQRYAWRLKPPAPDQLTALCAGCSLSFIILMTSPSCMTRPARVRPG